MLKALIKSLEKKSTRLLKSLNLEPFQTANLEENKKTLLQVS